MRENGGIPDQKLKTYIRIVVDDGGDIIDFEITRSSGNKSLDNSVKEAILLTQINEPPPIGMPRAMKFRISPQI
jgi:TonB family protein